jgi:hypothetical protein
LDAGEQLLTVELLAATIAFDDQQIGCNVLVGRKAPGALVTLPSPPDRIAGVAGVDDPMRIVAAMGTIHEGARC